MTTAIQTHLDQSKIFVNGFNLSNHFATNVQLSSDITISNENARFFRITELSSQEQFLLRQDLENVLASMKNPNFSWVYYLSGTKVGIEIYIGVVLTGKKDDVVKQSKLLKNQLLGNIAGMCLDEIKAQGLQKYILTPLESAKHFGLVTGVPSLTLDQQAHSQGESITQGLDRLATTLTGEQWQMLIVARPETLVNIEQKIEQLLTYASTLHPMIKQSLQEGKNSGQSETETEGSSESHSITVQNGTNESKSKTTNKNDRGSETESSGESESKSIAENKSKSDSSAKGTSTGESSGYSIEVLNKKLERIEKHINEKQMQRFELGLGKGLFQTAVYISAPDLETYERLSLAMTSIFQGNQMLFNPLQVHKIRLKDNNIHQLFDIHYKDSNDFETFPWLRSQFRPFTSDERDIKEYLSELGLIYSIPVNHKGIACATLLNTAELSLLAGFPSREVCGIRLRKNVDFAVNTHKTNEQDDFELGNIIQNGRTLEHAKVYLNKKLLNQHIFISGVTGAGKTTTCQQILTQSGLPFLVIEPAKTEYRSLYQLDNTIEYYTVNNESISPFRLNPFELLPNEQLAGHIDMLKATFAAVFPMEASMPYLIEEAIVRSYELKGWDINTSTNFLYENPYQHPEQCFPIMSELLEVLKKVIANKGFGKELQEKYEGSLISRLDNLTVGSKGRMLNTRVSIDVNALLDKKIVIELDDLKDEKDKALLMGFLIGRVAEAVKQRHKVDVNFQHITLIEEAHRLLEKPEGADDAKKLGVNLFANLLAEVRKYGECLIIADQIPNKLTPEVLKNTNTKIIHRLFAADDRQAIGETVGLTDEQKQFLPMLKVGEAIVYSAGWHEAVRTQVGRASDTNAPEIDENLIRQASQVRIFAERERLYPRLSGLVSTLDAVEFSQFVQDGLLLLNLWVRWYHQQNKSLKDVLWSHHQQELLIQRLKNEMLGFNDKWQAKTNQQALDGVAYLFEDVAPLAYVEVSKQYSISQALIYLFSLYEHDKLHEKIEDDSIFGLETGRLLKSVLASIFRKIEVL